jgi:hypothetical protein
MVSVAGTRGIARRPAAQGLALIFTVFCLGTLISGVQAKPVSTEQLQGE